MICQVFEVISRCKVVAVLETGGIGDVVAVDGNMRDELYEYLAGSHLFCPRFATLKGDVEWSSERKCFECSKIDFFLESDAPNTI